MAPHCWLLLALLLLAPAALAELPCDSPADDLTFMLNGGNLHWPCPATKNIYLTSGRYVSHNVIATRVQIYRDQAFVALPRYKHGVPFTLGKVCLKDRDCLAKMEPYPCWALQEEGNCQALQSVVDIFLDANDILWALDVGIVNTLETPIRRCPPKIVGISVKTGRVVKVIDLSALVTPRSRLQYLVIDYAPDGRPYVYVADAGSRAILVYDIALSKGYRVVLPQAVAAGCERRDVLYIELVRKGCNQDTILYFTYLSGERMFYIRSEHLRRGCARGSIVDVGLKPGPIVLLGTDNGAAIFFRKKGESDIYMWNTQTAFKPQNFLLVQPGGECRLATHVVPGYKRLMWVLESNFHDYIQGTVGCLGASIILKPLVGSTET